MSRFILSIALTILCSASAVNSQAPCAVTPATIPCKCNVGTCTVGQGCIPDSSFCTSRTCSTSALATAPCICNSAMCLSGHLCDAQSSACLSLDTCSGGGGLLTTKCLCGSLEAVCAVGQVCTADQSRCNYPLPCPNFGAATEPCKCGATDTICVIGQTCTHSTGTCST